MIVFCTTCKGRLDHLKQTLPKNLGDNPRSTFLVLDYGSQDGLLDWLKGEMHQHIESGRLVVYGYYDWPKYRFSHAKNLAHRLGIIEHGDVLVSLDADNFAGARFEDFAEEAFRANPRAYLWSRMIQGEMVRGINGRIGVSKQAFLNVGGYDEEKFADWGSEDRDFNHRLEMSGYDAIEIERSFLHAIPHNNKIRFKEFPQMLRGEYRMVDTTTIFKRVVNGGNFGCGAVYRNFGKQFEVIRPIPTRVFGVGLSKTGTTSLHKAFEHLGYESWHWSSAHVAKAIWQEMNNDGRSKTLERYYALCDLPIPLLYRKLDAAYPGSKFILTVRGAGDWLESVRRHFDPERNPWRSGWDNDPFSHRVHQLAYGGRDFDQEAFVDRYRQHNAEVQEYFRGRPESLLVLDLDKGDGWPELCGFLGLPEPSIPYPKAYVNGSEGGPK